MRTCLPLALAAACLGAVTIGHAYPSFLGATGGFEVPTADIQPLNTGAAAITYANTPNAATIPPRTVVGVAKGWEAGIAAVKQPGDDTLIIGAKYALTQVKVKDTALAAGMMYDTAAREADLYVVGTRAFKPGAKSRVSAGLLGTITDGDTGVHLFVGVDRALYGGASAGIEYVLPNSGESSNGPNVYYRAPLSATVTGEVGFLGIQHPSLAFGLVVSMDKVNIGRRRI